MFDLCGREGLSVRSFLVLIGTFILVYFAVPGLAILLVNRLPIQHLQEVRSIIAFLSSVLVYRFLRKRFSDKVPPV